MTTFGLCHESYFKLPVSASAVCCRKAEVQPKLLEEKETLHLSDFQDDFNLLVVCINLKFPLLHMQYLMKPAEGGRGQDNIMERYYSCKQHSTVHKVNISRQARR